jgi:hypothetical protein
MTTAKPAEPGFFGLRGPLIGLIEPQGCPLEPLTADAYAHLPIFDDLARLMSRCT